MCLIRLNASVSKDMFLTCNMFVNYCMKKRVSSKIQSPEMINDIKRCKDVSEAWLQGGKAIGEIIRPKKKQKM